MQLLIAGGGIAGLTMALTCHEIGVPVRVYESAPELRPFGLGINLQPNAVRELHDLGLADELAAIGVDTREVALVRRDGTDVWSEARGIEAGYRWPQYSVHRGELEMMLYRAAVERLGPEAIVTGHSVTGYEHSIGGVHVELQRSDGTTERIETTVLLGADGLHSAVRSRMFPGEGDPRWGGAVLWRGSAPGPPLRDGASFLVVGNTNQRFVTFPISEPNPRTGLQLHNWIAELRFDPSRGWRRGDWNTRVEVDEFIADFENWNFGWLDIPALIRRSEVVYEYPMVDRDPVDHWVHGSVALIGDAAHPMYPVGSNGASQAIVDARVLGAAFVEHGVGRDALHAYESALLDEMSALLLRNRGGGPVSVLGIVDQQRGSLFGDADTISSDEVEQFITGYRTATAIATERLNKAPPTIAPDARVRPS
jgi:2-polyprenyl-6-methoxyphenol hydroxylase-like FAD-dependent oxidoreductase